MILGTMAIDQYGQIYQIGKEPVRKWLLNYFCRKHADKMYRGMKDGKCKHVGYIIAKHWLHVYNITSWEK